MSRWFEDEDYRKRMKETNKRWVTKNPERFKELKKKWNQENQEYVRDCAKKYYQNHTEKQKAHYKKWRQENKSWTVYYQYLYHSHHERPDWKQFLKKEKTAFIINETKTRENKNGLDKRESE